MSDQVPGSSRADSIICVGNSMYPTLRALDILHISPYDGRAIRSGDVIVFKSNEHVVVTHRVVSASGNSIKTRGDNNSVNDKCTLVAGDVLGQVTAVRRNRRVLKVYGGLIGVQLGYLYHTERTVKLIVSSILQPFYHYASVSGVFRLWLPARLRPRVVNYQKSNGIEKYVLMGNKMIGTYNREGHCWMIRPPYRLFIDESMLVDLRS